MVVRLRGASGQTLCFKLAEVGILEEADAYGVPEVWR